MSFFRGDGVNFTRLSIFAAQFDSWTVNTREDMIDSIELGADNLITDVPALLRAVLDERARMSDAERVLLSLRNRLLR